MGTTPYPCEGCGVDRLGPFLGMANVPDKRTCSPLSVTPFGRKWAICHIRTDCLQRRRHPTQWLRRPGIPRAIGCHAAPVRT